MNKGPKNTGKKPAPPTSLCQKLCNKPPKSNEGKGKDVSPAASQERVKNDTVNKNEETNKTKSRNKIKAVLKKLKKITTSLPKALQSPYAYEKGKKDCETCNMNKESFKSVMKSVKVVDLIADEIIEKEKSEMLDKEEHPRKPNEPSKKEEKKLSLEFGVYFQRTIDHNLKCELLKLQKAISSLLLQLCYCKAKKNPGNEKCKMYDVSVNVIEYLKFENTCLINTIIQLLRNTSSKQKSPPTVCVACLKADLADCTEILTDLLKSGRNLKVTMRNEDMGDGECCGRKYHHVHALVQGRNVVLKYELPFEVTPDNISRDADSEHSPDSYEDETGSETDETQEPDPPNTDSLSNKSMKSLKNASLDAKDPIRKLKIADPKSALMNPMESPDKKPLAATTSKEKPPAPPPSPVPSSSSGKRQPPSTGEAATTRPISPAASASSIKSQPPTTKQTTSETSVKNQTQDPRTATVDTQPSAASAVAKDGSTASSVSKSALAVHSTHASSAHSTPPTTQENTDTQPDTNDSESVTLQESVSRQKKESEKKRDNSLDPSSSQVSVHNQKNVPESNQKKAPEKQRENSGSSTEEEEEELNKGLVEQKKRASEADDTALKKHNKASTDGSSSDSSDSVSSVQRAGQLKDKKVSFPDGKGVVQNVYRTVTQTQGVFKSTEPQLKSALKKQPGNKKGFSIVPETQSSSSKKGRESTLKPVDSVVLVKNRYSLTDKSKDKLAQDENQSKVPFADHARKVNFQVLRSEIKQKGMESHDEMESKSLKSLNKQQVGEVLKDLGAKKLMSVSVPAECCKDNASVKNFKCISDLPFSASLHSLPLDQEDLNHITEAVKHLVTNDDIVTMIGDDEWEIEYSNDKDDKGGESNQKVQWHNAFTAKDTASNLRIEIQTDKPVSRHKILKSPNRKEAINLATIDEEEEAKSRQNSQLNVKNAKTDQGENIPASSPKTCELRFFTVEYSNDSVKKENSEIENESDNRDKKTNPCHEKCNQNLDKYFIINTQLKIQEEIDVGYVSDELFSLCGFSNETQCLELGKLNNESKEQSETGNDCNVSLSDEMVMREVIYLTSEKKSSTIINPSKVLYHFSDCHEFPISPDTCLREKNNFMDVKIIKTPSSDSLQCDFMRQKQDFGEKYGSTRQSEQSRTDIVSLQLNKSSSINENCPIELDYYEKNTISRMCLDGWRGNGAFFCNDTSCFVTESDSQTCVLAVENEEELCNTSNYIGGTRNIPTSPCCVSNRPTRKTNHRKEFKSNSETLFTSESNESLKTILICGNIFEQSTDNIFMSEINIKCNNLVVNSNPNYGLKKQLDPLRIQKSRNKPVERMVVTEENDKMNKKVLSSDFQLGNNSRCRSTVAKSKDGKNDYNFKRRSYLFHKKQSIMFKEKCKSKNKVKSKDVTFFCENNSTSKETIPCNTDVEGRVVQEPSTTSCISRIPLQNNVNLKRHNMNRRSYSIFKKPIIKIVQNISHFTGKTYLHRQRPTAEVGSIRFKSLKFKLNNPEVKYSTVILLNINYEIPVLIMTPRDSGDMSPRAQEDYGKTGIIQSLKNSDETKAVRTQDFGLERLKSVKNTKTTLESTVEKTVLTTSDENKKENTRKVEKPPGNKSPRTYFTRFPNNSTNKTKKYHYKGTYYLFDIDGRPLTDGSRRPLQMRNGEPLLKFNKDGSHICDSSFPVFDSFMRSVKDEHFNPEGTPCSDIVKVLAPTGRPMVLYDVEGRPLTSESGTVLVNAAGEGTLQFDCGGKPVCDAVGGPIFNVNSKRFV